MDKKSFFILLFLLALSVFRYFYLFPQRAMFEFDQEYLALSAKSILIDHKFTLIGAPTSVGGMFVGPLYNYFMAGVFWLASWSPFAVDFISQSWAVLTVLVIYVAGSRLYGKTAALFSALFALLSVNFLNNSSLPPLLFPLPLISLLMFYILERKKISFMWLAVLLGISFQLHFTAIFFLPMIVIMLAIRKPGLKLKQLMLPFCLFLLFLLPLIFFELRHVFFISKNFLQFIRHNQNGSFNFLLQFWKSFYISLENLGGLVVPLAGLLIKVFTSLSIVSIVLFLGKKKKIIRNSLIWILAPIICFSFYKGHIINYYFLIQEPTFFLILGFGTSKIFSKRNLGKIAAVFILIVFAYLNFSAGFFRISDSSLNYKKQAFDLIKKKMNDEKFYLSYTIEPAKMGGYRYMPFYYRFNLANQPSEEIPTATIIQPHTWHNIKSDYIFGDIGVGFSKNENN